MVARYRKSASAKEMVYEYLKDAPRANSVGHEISDPLHVPKTFPPFFADQLDATGSMLDASFQTSPTTGVATVPVLTTLRNSNTTKPHLATLIKGLRSLNVRSHPTFFENKDALEETLEQLESLLGSYDE